MCAVRKRRQKPKHRNRNTSIVEPWLSEHLCSWANSDNVFVSYRASLVSRVSIAIASKLKRCINS